MAVAIAAIKKTPTVIKGIHESCFRSYQILRKVEDMLQRKDSIETILEVIYECQRGIDETEFLLTPNNNL